MCGIYGWSIAKKSGLPAGKREAMASVLSVANSLRGDESWGFYTATREGKPFVRRRVGDIAKMQGTGRLGRLSLVMAHTRYATSGKVTEKNAHPLTSGKIILAHNGVITNSDELDKKYGRNVRVDSLHLAMHLDSGLPFDDIEGYGAIEWVEEENPRFVNLSRLRSGSLSVFGLRNWDRKHVGIAWSSDEAHLKSALGAARIDCYSFETLTEGQIYSARDGDLYKLDRPILKLAEPAYGYGYAGYGRSGYWVSSKKGNWEYRDDNTLTGKYWNKFLAGEHRNLLKPAQNPPEGAEDEEEDVYAHMMRGGLDS